MAVNAQAFETIELSIDRAVATLRLNRPDDLNPLSLEMARELLAALELLESDPAVRAVLVTGSGRAFSAGTDLKADRPQTPAGKPAVLTGLRAVSTSGASPIPSSKPPSPPKLAVWQRLRIALRILIFGK